MGQQGEGSEDPVTLGDSLTRVVRSLRNESPDAPGPTMSALGGVFGRWEEAVGPAVAHHVQPIKLEGRRLVVEVDDPAWATQLKFLEATVRSRLAEVAGAQIDTIDVRVRRH